MFSFLDTTDRLDATKIKAAGYDGALKYSFNTKLYPHKTWSQEEFNAFGAAGLKRAMCFEKGNTQDTFTGPNGIAHATQLVTQMHTLGFPRDIGIGAFMTYDLDIAITPEVILYQRNAREVIKDAGYLPGAYGDGSLFDEFEKLGICHYFWLTQSKGFPGYENWLSKADIVQSLTVPIGLAGDNDSVKSTGNATRYPWAY